MSEIFDQTVAAFSPMHNDLCILYDTEIVRLVGVHDGRDDIYYRVRTLQPRPGGDREILASAVGHLVSLRDHYPAERYACMDKIFTINGAGPVDRFRVTREAATVTGPATPRIDEESK